MHSTFRRLSVVALVALACMAPAGAFAAKAVDAACDVGYGGYVTRGGIYPLRVMVDNRLVSSEGLIEVSDADAGLEPEVRQVRRFESPVRSRKMFDFPVRVDAVNQIQVRIRFASKELQSIRMIPQVKWSTEPLVLCLDAPPSFKAGEAAKKYRFVDVSPDELPRDPMGLYGIHAVFITGGRLAMLERKQVDALRAWTACGGRLVILDPPPGADLRSLIGAPATGPEPLKLTDEIRKFGSGMIAASAPGEDPSTLFWTMSQRARRTLFPALDKEENVFTPQFMAGLFDRLWKVRRSYGLMAFLMIILIVGAYVLVIWPLDRFIVRRLKRPLLTWAVFFAAIVVFSVISYGYSSLANVGEMRMLAVTVVDAVPEYGVARGLSQFWVYSVKNATYSLEATRDDVCLSARQGSMAAAGAVAGVEIENGRTSRATARIPIFSSRKFDAGWYMPWTNAVKVSRQGRMLKVETPAGLNVRHIVLADRLRMYELNRIREMPGGAPKAAQEWNVLLDESSSTNSYARNLLDQKSRRVNDHVQKFSYSHGGAAPDDSLLQDYLVCMSYPTPATESLLAQRDSIEESLDVSHRIGAGMTLMVFLEPDRSMLPVALKKYSPRVEQVNMVRYWLD